MCDFCENGKKMKADYKGEGITTALNMIDMLFGVSSDDDNSNQAENMPS